MFSRDLVSRDEQGIERLFRCCSIIITVNVPEEKTWIPD
jgi:hypothetical protein